MIDRDKILEDIADLQKQTDNPGFKGQNEYDLFLRELIADYILEPETSDKALPINDVRVMYSQDDVLEILENCTSIKDAICIVNEGNDGDINP